MAGKYPEDSRMKRKVQKLRALMIGQNFHTAKCDWPEDTEVYWLLNETEYSCCNFCCMQY